MVAVENEKWDEFDPIGHSAFTSTSPLSERAQEEVQKNV
jgi:hypothetical protein